MQTPLEPWLKEPHLHVPGILFDDGHSAISTLPPYPDHLFFAIAIGIGYGHFACTFIAMGLETPGNGIVMQEDWPLKTIWI